MGLAAEKIQVFSPEIEAAPKGRTVNIARTRALAVIPGTFFTRPPTRRTRLADLRMLAFILIAFQLFDGFCTAIGVLRFGPEIEANLLVRSLIESLGCLPAVVSIKLAAVLGILMICIIGTQIRWLVGAMRFVALVYLIGAVLPWTYFFVSDAFATPGF